MIGSLIALLALSGLGHAHDFLEKRICVVYHSVHGLEKESPQDLCLSMGSLSYQAPNIYFFGIYNNATNRRAGRKGIEGPAEQFPEKLHASTAHAKAVREACGHLGTTIMKGFHVDLGAPGAVATREQYLKISNRLAEALQGLSATREAGAPRLHCEYTLLSDVGVLFNINFLHFIKMYARHGHDVITYRRAQYKSLEDPGLSPDYKSNGQYWDTGARANLYNVYDAAPGTMMVSPACLSKIRLATATPEEDERMAALEATFLSDIHPGDIYPAHRAVMVRALSACNPYILTRHEFVMAFATEADARSGGERPRLSWNPDARPRRIPVYSLPVVLNPPTESTWRVVRSGRFWEPPALPLPALPADFKLCVVSRTSSGYQKAQLCTFMGSLFKYWPQGSVYLRMIYPVKGDLPLWEAQYKAMLSECPFGSSVPKGTFEASGAPGDDQVPKQAKGENDVGYLATNYAVTDLYKNSPQCSHFLVTNSDNIYSPYLADGLAPYLAQGIQVIAFNFVSHYNGLRYEPPQFRTGAIDLGAMIFSRTCLAKAFDSNEQHKPFSPNPPHLGGWGSADGRFAELVAGSYRCSTAIAGENLFFHQ